MIVSVSLSLAGYSYSAWTDKVVIIGKVKMAHISITAISHKVLWSKCVGKYSTILYDLSEDGHTLWITANNLQECWYVWIGLVLQNQGSLPALVKETVLRIEGFPELVDIFETQYYFYGPYPESTGFGTLPTWGSVKIGDQLEPDGNVNFLETPTDPPFTADPGEKAVVWIWLHVGEEVPPEAQGKTIQLFIDIVDDMAI
jgi:hypothetical protein